MGDRVTCVDALARGAFGPAGGTLLRSSIRVRQPEAWYAWLVCVGRRATYFFEIELNKNGLAWSLTCPRELSEGDGRTDRELERERFRVKCRKNTLPTPFYMSTHGTEGFLA